MLRAALSTQQRSDMIAAFALALGQFSDPAFRRTVLLGLGLSALMLGALAALMSFLPAYAVPSGWEWTMAPAAALGGLAGLLLAWLLFPALSAVAAGLLGDRIALIVEHQHYPSAPGARSAGIFEGLFQTLRLVLAGLLLNLLALPVYLLIPGINLILFLALNGYLVGREYFESAAARRFSADEARRLRRSIRLRLWGGGALLAGLMTVPGLNLLAPYLGYAAMVHMVERERIRQSDK